MPTFIIDCPDCKAKVGVEQSGAVEESGYNDEVGEPYGEKIVVGKCPSCKTLLAGYSFQTSFKGWEGDEDDRWSDALRVYPHPPKTFSSFRIPRVLTQSLTEADKTMQVGAYMAAVVMFGRSLEALCRDVLKEKKLDGEKQKKHLMLGAGIRELRDRKIIDDRLFDWSQDLNAFRNLAAHPDEDFSLSRQDAEDLQAFVHAITEYVYDLADRYEEFKRRKTRNKDKSPF